MILTDREIMNSLAAGLLKIHPAPDPSAFSSTSVDCTLSPSLRVFRPHSAGLSVVIDPSAPHFKVSSVLDGLTEKVEIDPVNGYELGPQTLVLGWTRESIELELHGRVAARVEGKSSLERFPT